VRPVEAARQLPAVAILAGGLGTRLGDAVRDTPKPLLPVAGRPFALWQLELLRSHGAQQIVMCVGYRGDQIEQEIGAPFGLDVAYVHDPPELAGTAGALRGALGHLGDRFLVLYGDTYLRIDYGAVAEAHAASGLPGLMTVLRNAGRWDASNARFDGERVTEYRKGAEGMEWIDYGLGVLRAEVLAESEETDLAEVYGALAARGELAGYAASERFYEIGTPDSLAETSAFLAASSSPSSGSRRA
jgi:N-acetyl-alpha-D-muramate 1-phosphate uridylyltransferase